MSDRIDEIKARLEAATPGEWVHKNHPQHYDIQYTATIMGRSVTQAWKPFFEYANTDNDAEFIAHAPQDIEYLLGEVARLRAENANGKELLELANGYNDEIKAENARLREDLQRENIKIEVQAALIDRQKKAIAAVEVVMDSGSDTGYCPWCNAEEEYYRDSTGRLLTTINHKPDCQRQAALRGER
jgi:hypothetical protein